MSTSVARGRIYNPDQSRPKKDPKYRAWIRTLPCAVCSRTRGVECAHTGDRGLSQKSDDRRGIPLCRAHHQEYHRIGRRKFEQTYRLNIEALIIRLNERPRISIREGFFIAQFQSEEYRIGPVTQGIRKTVHTAIAICQERFVRSAAS